MKIYELLAKVRERQASDLILKAGSPPLMRIHGELVSIGEERLGPDAIQGMAKTIVTESEWQRFAEEMELDLACEVEGAGRFRINMFKQRGSMSVVCRQIVSEVPTVEVLDLPPAAVDLALRPRGLVLVTGPAASGKSTTQAALINHRNSNEACHIMTVEDPIEFIHQDKKGLVNQRQVGRDTLSFTNGLKYVLRQNPDVILIGEMRDLETISMALTAAETGHLAIGTLHTINATQTIDRVINAFPAHQQQQIRIQMSANLVGVISQVLVDRKNEAERIACFEVLLATQAVRNTIREGKTHQIPQLMETGTKDGMKSMERSLTDLVKKGIISADEAFAKSSRPEVLTQLLDSQAASAGVGIF